MRYLYLLMLFLLIPLATATVTTSNPVVDITWTIDTPQPSPMTLTFASSVEDTVSLSISGNASNFVSVSPTMLTFTNSSLSKVTALNFALPSTPGLYRGSISYRDGTIPIFILVQKKEVIETCRLRAVTSDFITSVKEDTAPFSERFVVKVSKGCTAPVNIEAIIPSGPNLIHTDEGTKPIRLQGALSLGEKEPGEDITFNVLIDVKGLASGVIYSSVMKVIGTYKDNPLVADINFRIAVSKSSSPLLTENKNPVFVIPDNAVTGEPFNIEVTELDPNMQPTMIFNPDLNGHSVIRDGDKWTWTGSINKTGNVIVEMYVSFFGGQIGSPIKKTIFVSAEASQRGDTLKFDYFPSISEITQDSLVNVLLRDNKTNNIVKGDVYLNGRVITDNTIEMKVGQKYCLSAVVSGYSTLDQCVEVQPRKLLLILDPPEPKIGQTVTFLVQDPISGEQILNALVTLNGQSISTTHTIQEEGTYIVSASSEGYLSSGNITFTIKDELRIISTNPLIKNKPTSFLLNKNVTWQVVYMKTTGDKQELVAQGNTAQINFTPTKKGLYQIWSGDKDLLDINLGSPSQSSGNTWLWVIIGIIVFFLIVWLFKRRGRSGGIGVPRRMPISVTEEL